LDKGLGGPQNLYGQHGEEKMLAPTGIGTPDTSPVQPIAYHISTNFIPFMSHDPEQVGVAVPL
jgi:hypothetical protein